MLQIADVTIQTKEFKAKFRKYLRQAGKTQEGVAFQLGMSGNRFSERLNSVTSWGFFNPKEVASIICFLDKYNAFFTQAEKYELLCTAYPPPEGISSRDWFNKWCSSLDNNTGNTNSSSNAEMDLPSGDVSEANLLHSLPNAVTTDKFLGKNKELLDAYALLSKSGQNSSCRLLTIMGFGGVGKTRFSLELVSQLQKGGIFRDGICFVPLAELEAGECLKLPAVIAKTLNLKQTVHHANSQSTILGNPDAELTLAENVVATTGLLMNYLRNKHMLLVLDNLEQLLCNESTGLVATLLANCPHLKILVTSREALRVRGERVIKLTGLEVPDETELDATTIASYPAVALFMSRAEEVLGGFTLTEENNALMVATICRKLSGLPLAIELAASRVSYLGIEGLVNLLRHATVDYPTSEIMPNGNTSFLRFLASRAGTLRLLPQRHQSLKVALDWSFDLLSSNEKDLLIQLAVFSQSFTLDAATAICNVTENESGASWLYDEAGTTEEIIFSLMDKSLLQVENRRVTSNDGAALITNRYCLLEVVRHYARGKFLELEYTAQIQAHNERGAIVGTQGKLTVRKDIAERHANYYLDFVKRAEVRLTSKEQNRAAGEVLADYTNILNALSWFWNNERLEEACQLAAALTQFWYTSPAYSHEGSQWLMRLVERVRASDTTDRAMGDSSNDNSKASNNALRVVTDYPAISEFTRARLYHQAARLSNTRDNSEQNRSELEALLHQSLRLLKALKQEAVAANNQATLLEIERELGRVYNNLGNIYYYRANYEQATVYYTESLELARVTGDTYGSIGTLTNFAFIRYLESDFGEAKELYRKLAEYNREQGDTVAQASSVKLAGLAAMKDLEFGEALELFHESLALISKPGRGNIHVTNSGFTLDILMYQGLTHQMRYQSFEGGEADFSLAATYYRNGLALAGEISITRYVPFYALYTLRLVLAYIKQNESKGGSMVASGRVNSLVAEVFRELETVIRLKPELVTTEFDSQDKKIYEEVKLALALSLVVTGEVVMSASTDTRELTNQPGIDPVIAQEFILANRAVELLGMFLGSWPDVAA